MKKLLVFVLVLGLASLASASITFTAPGQLPCPSFPHPDVGDFDVEPGTIVTITVFSPETAASSYTLSITETTTSAAGHSTAVAVGTGNAGFDNIMQPGTLRNAMTTAPTSATSHRYMLIDKISGGINQSTTPQVPAGEALYTFSVQIPADAVFCDTFTITAAIGTPNFGGAGYTHNLNAQAQGVVPPGCNSVTLHVIPEPATIALLGLGGLLLKRRK